MGQGVCYFVLDWVLFKLFPILHRGVLFLDDGLILFILVRKGFSEASFLGSELLGTVGKAYQLGGLSNLLVDVLDLTQLGPRKHILQILPPINK